MRICDAGRVPECRFIAACLNEEALTDDRIDVAFETVDTDDSGIIEKKELQSLFLGFREHIDLPALHRSRMYDLPCFSNFELPAFMVKGFGLDPNHPPGSPRNRSCSRYS